MPQIQIDIHDSGVKTKLDHAALAVKNLPPRVIAPEIEQARKDIVEPYPPELPGQRYVRTGTRYRATKVQPGVGNNQYQSKYTLVSNPYYPGGRSGNPYTIGDAAGDGQAKIHQGRWTLMRTAMQNAMARIVEKGAEFFRAVIERDQIP